MDQIWEVGGNPPSSDESDLTSSSTGSGSEIIGGGARSTGAGGGKSSSSSSPKEGDGREELSEGGSGLFSFGNSDSLISATGGGSGISSFTSSFSSSTTGGLGERDGAGVFLGSAGAETPSNFESNPPSATFLTCTTLIPVFVTIAACLDLLQIVDFFTSS